MRLFQKEEVLFVLRVFSSIKRRVCFCFHVLQERVLRRIKPPPTSLVFGMHPDQHQFKARLLDEKDWAAPPTAHPAATS